MRLQQKKRKTEFSISYENDFEPVFRAIEAVTEIIGSKGIESCTAMLEITETTKSIEGIIKDATHSGNRLLPVLPQLFNSSN